MDFNLAMPIDAENRIVYEMNTKRSLKINYNLLQIAQTVPGSEPKYEREDLQYSRCTTNTQVLTDSDTWPASDLNADYVALVAGEYVESESLVIAFSVTNISTTDAGQCEANFFATNTLGSVVFLGSGSPSQLAAGESYQDSVSLPLDELSAGTWSVNMTLYFRR